jgi:hypothetical protein
MHLVFKLHAIERPVQARASQALQGQYDILLHVSDVEDTR